jgi:hypothetical protein
MPEMKTAGTGDEETGSSNTQDVAILDPGFLEATATSVYDTKLAGSTSLETLNTQLDIPRTLSSYDKCLAAPISKKKTSGKKGTRKKGIGDPPSGA